MRHVALVLAFVALVAGAPATASAADEAVTYQPPVHGIVTDPFGMPASPYAAGNRGLEYATTPGSPVVAAADGEVVFAGQVGGTLHVVVLHADGIRTSYSFLASISAARGDHVQGGHAVGTTGSSTHFGARAGDAYVDPAVLLDDGPVHVRLVAEPLRHAQSEEHERRGVLGMLSSMAGVGSRATEAGVAWAAHQAVESATAPIRGGVTAARAIAAHLGAFPDFAEYARALGDPLAWMTTIAGDVYDAAAADCTDPDIVPPPLSTRHILVEVAGLGSHTGTGHHRFEAGAVARVRAGDLGYAADDVVEFSYGGGTTREHSYTAADTQVDIRMSARRLADLLRHQAALHPGVPIDIVAHSQGGLVARAALAYDINLDKPGHPPIASLTTLATPHHGANLATAGAMLGASAAGSGLERAAGDLQLGGINPRSASVRQLAETSHFIRDLNRRPLPPGVRFTSVAGRGDVVVPTPRAHVDGAHNVIVDPPGTGFDHDGLPGSDAAYREVALAVNGLPPRCKSLWAHTADALIGETVSQVEATAGAGLGAAGHALSPPSAN
jgi:hypothetical protein